MPDGQKQRLIDQKNAAEAKLDEMMRSFQAQLTALGDQITGGFKAKALTALSKGDKDVSSKIELKFNSLMKTGDYKNDEAGITQAMSEAATLVLGSRPAPTFMDNMGGAGNRGDGAPAGAAKPETENGKAMRAVFGISDKDAEKYSGQIKQ